MQSVDFKRTKSKQLAALHEDMKRRLERQEAKLDELRHVSSQIPIMHGLLKRITDVIEEIDPRLSLPSRRHRYKVKTGCAAAAMGISKRELLRILKGEVTKPEGFPGLDDELGFYAWVSVYRRRKTLGEAVKKRNDEIRKWGRQHP